MTSVRSSPATAAAAVSIPSMTKYGGGGGGSSEIAEDSFADPLPDPLQQPQPQPRPRPQSAARSSGWWWSSSSSRPQQPQPQSRLSSSSSSSSPTSPSSSFAQATATAAAVAGRVDTTTPPPPPPTATSSSSPSPPPSLGKILMQKIRHPWGGGQAPSPAHAASAATLPPFSPQADAAREAIADRQLLWRGEDVLWPRWPRFLYYAFTSGAGAGLSLGLLKAALHPSRRRVLLLRLRDSVARLLPRYLLSHGFYHGTSAVAVATTFRLGETCTRWYFTKTSTATERDRDGGSGSSGDGHASREDRGYRSRSFLVGGCVAGALATLIALENRRLSVRVRTPTPRLWGLFVCGSLAGSAVGGLCEWLTLY